MSNGNGSINGSGNGFFDPYARELPEFSDPPANICTDG